MTFVKVYLSDPERERLTAEATTAGRSLSAYVHDRIFEHAPDGELPVELRAVLTDHAERLAELTAWHERSKAERAAWEARGWRSPLQHPDEFEQPASWGPSSSKPKLMSAADVDKQS